MKTRFASIVVLLSLFCGAPALGQDVHTMCDNGGSGFTAWSPCPGTSGKPSTTSIAPVTYTDKSITSATGSSQTLAAANTARKSLVIINPVESTTSWGINALGGSAIIGTAPTVKLNPGDSWAPWPVPTNAITGIGTSTSQLVVLEGN